MRNKRCLFYVHDGYGIGHLGRVAALTWKLKNEYPEIDIIVITGDNNAGTILHPGVEWIKLPSFRIVPDNEDRMRIYPASLSSYALTVTLRKKIIATVFDYFLPKVVIIDHLARGMGRELAPIIRKFKYNNPNNHFVLGLRGLMGKKQQAYHHIFAAGDLDYIKEIYTKILVYLDKSILDVASFYNLPTWGHEKIKYTGYVVNSKSKMNSSQSVSSYIPISSCEEYLGIGLGSGVNAEAILTTILKVLPFIKNIPSKIRVVTGPKFSDKIFQQMKEKYPTIRFKHFESQYASFIEKAKYFIGLGGYNTITIRLKSKKPGLFIARTQYSEGEQEQHLNLLADSKLCIMIKESDMSEDRLIQSLRLLVKGTKSKHNLAMDGDTVTAEYINILMKS